VQQVKEDFLETLPHCQEVTMEDCRSPLITRLIQDILRVFAPII
jgi:hypothetical protein